MSNSSGSSGFSGLTMPFTQRSSERLDASTRPASASSFANSPVNGLLYVRGIVGKRDHEQFCTVARSNGACASAN